MELNAQIKNVVRRVAVLEFGFFGLEASVALFIG